MTEPASPAEPAMPGPVPAEPAVAKPPPQPPAVRPVLRTLLSLLRRHGLRLFLIAFVMSLMLLASALLMTLPMAALQHCGVPILLDWWPIALLFSRL